MLIINNLLRTIYPKKPRRISAILGLFSNNIPWIAGTDSYSRMNILLQSPKLSWNNLRRATSPGYPGGIPSMLAMTVISDIRYSGGVP
jgi:hypothetical protein